MPELSGLALTHPFWLWLALGALFLIGELLTGSGWLLWPAGSAVVTGLAALTFPVPEPWSWVLFALVTVVTTVLGRRFLPQRGSGQKPDINDQTARLLGLTGTVASGFEAGAGRVLVEGTEWPARCNGHDPAAGEHVRVAGIEGTTLIIEKI